MRKRIAVVMVALGMVTVVGAQDETKTEAGLYLGGKLTIFNAKAKLSVSSDYGSASATGRENFTGLTAAIGYRVSQQFRCEGEFGYVSKNNVDITTLMGQFYMDFPIANSPVQPYVNVGFGGVWYEEPFTKVYLDGPLSGACLNMGAGCAFKVSERLSIDIAYRYFQTSKLKFDVESVNCDLTLGASMFMMGATYRF